MYVRHDRQLRNGRYVTYLSLAHNVKVESPKGKRTKPIVFANLGNEDDLSYEVASGRSAPLPAMSRSAGVRSRKAISGASSPGK